jgi:hypothetical protein
MIISATSLCLRAAPAFAAPPEPLDVEFLDYLAACEGKDDNWTVVADDKLRKKAESKPPVPKQPPATEGEKAQESRP